MAESQREQAEELRKLAESARESAEASRKAVEEARKAAEEARKHRDQVLLIAEELRRKAESVRSVAEQTRRTTADRFDTDTRRAIREELEIASEVQRTRDELRGPAPTKRRRPSRG